MNKKTIIYIVIIIAILVVSYFFFLYRNGKPKEVITPVLPNVSTPGVVIPVATTTSIPVPVTTSKTYTISIINFAFSPANLDINIGDTIVWTNNDGAPHQIIGDSLNSPIMSKGQTFSQTFNKSGAFSYHCSIHPSMKGVINIK